MTETSGVLPSDGERLAWRRVDGAGPTVVWLGGFRSDMAGTKAQVLADWALAKGRAFLRFDYSAHGESSGDFAEGTIGRWRSDSLAVIDQLTEGPLILVGSSMGGWMACLAALARPDRVAGMVLVAPAPDFTEKLMEPALSAQAREAIVQDVPWSHALLLEMAIASEDVVFTLIRDGDHRLSRPQDLARLLAAVEELA
ncbi:MAG: alpha/beta hydrolase [Caulobacterales bacterium 32-69-10]|nr:MAG: alpha/beta hydrolase [Caulobacterales bacterium 32-69-10]